MNLLVHSGQGVSRAPAIVVNFVMRRDKLGYEEAFEVVKGRRDGVCIKEGLAGQLKHLKY